MERNRRCFFFLSASIEFGDAHRLRAQIANRAHCSCSIAMATKADGVAEYGCRDDEIAAADRRVALEEAVGRSDLMTVGALQIDFFLDRVGFYLGSTCVVLATLSKTIERTAYD